MDKSHPIESAFTEVRTFSFPITMLVLALATSAHAGETAARTYQLPEDRLLTLAVPEGWQSETQLPPGRPLPVLKFTRAGKDFVASITVQALSPPGVETPLAQLQGMVAKQAQRLAILVGADSVEVNTIDGPQASGYYFSVSEATRKPGEYQYLTSGLVAVGEATASFEVLTNKGAEAAVADMLTMVTAAELSSPRISAPDQVGNAPVTIRQADAPETQLLQRQVRLTMDFYWDDTADGNEIVAATYPRAVAAGGGAAGVLAAVTAMRQQMRDLGTSRESSGFPGPPTIIETSRRAYATVPTHMVVRAGDKRIESYNYQFGILEPGSSRWTYLEGSRVNAAMLREWFPDFPDDYAFPRVSREVSQDPLRP